MTMAHSNKKMRSYRSMPRGGGNIFLTARSLSKTEFLMEPHKFLPPCMSENMAGCVRHYSSQLVIVLFLSFCILAQNIYDHKFIELFCLKIESQRCDGSQEAREKDKRHVNEGSTKDTGIY